MVLIADCGGTKTDWCLVDGENVVTRFSAPGKNAVMMPFDEMAAQIKVDIAKPLKDYVGDITHVYFYGAGCISDNVCKHVRFALGENLPSAKIHVYSDMLGTARALCGDAPGIVCILGTGSNSCYYDGTRIADNVPSLGYILGDEGSGAYLGKVLVNSVLKRQLPEEICCDFCDKYRLDAVKVVHQVYREQHANRFLASLSPFVKENIDHPAIHALAVEAFSDFFRKNVVPYSHTDAAGREIRTVSLSGSVACNYRGVIQEVADRFGYAIGAVEQSPMEGLVRYHSSRV